MFGERVSSAILRVSCWCFVRSLLVLFMHGLLYCLPCMDPHGLRSCSPRIVPVRSALLLARSVAAWDALLVASLPPHDPPGISSGPVPAPSVRLLVWSRPSAQYLVWTCSYSVCALARLVLSLSAILLALPCPVSARSVRPTSRLVLSLHGPPNISSGPVHARSAHHLVWPCPCTVHLTSPLVLSKHGLLIISSGPAPLRSAEHLVGSCPCTVRPTSRLVLSLYRPHSCTSRLVPARSAQHLVW